MSPLELRALARVGALLAAFVAASACAQGYPSAPLRIVVPYTPGGGTDILARLLGARLGESWGQPVMVDNRAGANGTLGAAIVAKAPGDGYTLLMAPAGYAANPALYKALPYDQTRELAGVSLLASGPLVLVVHPSLPAKSIAELIALARARPGELNMGSAGNGSLPHLSGELFMLLSGARLEHIPYKGASAAVADLLTGRTPVYFMNILQCLQFVKAGKLRGLGVTTPARSPIAPDLPAIAERLKGFDMTNWYGLFVPATTPREIVARINAEVTRILRLAELKSRLADDGMTVVAGSADEFAGFVARETAKYERIIDAAGIKGSL